MKKRSNIHFVVWCTHGGTALLERNLIFNRVSNDNSRIKTEQRGRLSRSLQKIMRFGGLLEESRVGERASPYVSLACIFDGHQSI
ncbi:CGH_1_HP_G0064650.mRNA.1.CDS.1 [Saccharomyces cerevisiae]|nr:CGH_1_HP_G0064650.mRNA.1.CDS.1 [Saccharomyces cerevisiae]CAI6851640.1 CGH_1_HP_G0064650.mRNA.1.CDS.1 [Saccharomyces cerevisiae]